MKYVLLLVFFWSCNGINKEHGPAAFQSNKSYLSDSEKQIIIDLPYNISPGQKLDVYFPKNHNENTRTIFYIHGGGWFAGDKSEAFYWAEYFQELGYVVVSINYRLADRNKNNVYPSQIADIDSAINFILKRSEDWKISKTNNIIMGASAGAQLALQYAYNFNESKKIKAAISFCGALDLTDSIFINADVGPGMNMNKTNFSTLLTWYLGDTITNKPNIWKDASPVNHITSSSVPSFFLHGKSDEKIPYQQSLKAFNILKSLGVHCQLELLENVNHDLLSLDLNDQLKKVDKFINANVPN